MSTRRARIKAVTSLPPRRKNGDHSDNKTKQVLDNEVNVPPKSPRTPRSQLKVGNALGKSPASKTDLLVKSSENIPESVKIQTAVDANVLPSSEPIASSIRPIFVSPQAVGSPRRKPVPSPVKTPKAVENAPQNIPEKQIAAVLKPCETEKRKEQAREPTKTGIDKVCSENKSDVPDDYNVPSVPESVTEDAMDGIIPLQPACSAPKPIDLLKNEIISEKAEVLFDPIVPLPSPSKTRPKLRPVPRLTPVRRNSRQGSASESEDENRRGLHHSGSAGIQRQRRDSQTSQSTVLSQPNREMIRVRNDSVCSSASLVLANPALSPVKEKHYSKSRRQEISRRMTALRRRRETIKRDNLTMYDLIFYNPESNPFVPDQDELDAKEANEKEALKVKPIEKDDSNDESTDAAPVPQIKLGPNGEIVLDEQSLVINQSASNRKVSSVVREGSWGGSGNSYRRTARTADWSDAETVRFYRALAAIGTDFSLMEPLFPGRKRRDLKIKFKKEEKINGAQVDKALRARVEWDAVRLLNEFSIEREEAAKKAQQAKERLMKEKQAQNQRKLDAKELGMRQSRCAKALGTSVMPEHKLNHNEEELSTANQIIQHAIEEKQNKRRRRKPAPVLQKVPIPAPVLQKVPIPALNVIKTPQQNVIKTPQQQIINSPFATLTLVPNSVPQLRANPTELLISGTVKPSVPITNPVAAVPGSLVVLTVNDPNSPSKKMLQTYIAHGEGVLTPIALPPTLLNSVVGYMQRGTPKSNVSSVSSISARSSPVVASPIMNNDRNSITPSDVQNPGPMKRQRLSSYTITSL